MIPHQGNFSENLGCYDIRVAKMKKTNKNPKTTKKQTKTKKTWTVSGTVENIGQIRPELYLGVGLNILGNATEPEVVTHTFKPALGKHRQADLCEFEASLIYNS